MSNTAGITEQYNDGTYLKKIPTWDSGHSPWKARLTAKILADNGIMPQTVAEVGCGAGEILINLQKMGIGQHFVGYELSQDAYKLCAPKQNDHLSFHLGDITKSGHTFDVLLCMDVFEHVENYIEFTRNLKGMASHTVFHIPLDISASAVLRGKLIDARHSVGHLHHFTAETAVATLEDCGFEVIDSRFSAPFAKDGLPVQTWRQNVMRYVRRPLFAISPNLLSRTLGGCSILALAR